MDQLSIFDTVSDKASSNLWHLYIDGAARNNPGPAGAGVYILKNGEIFFKKGYALGVKTNNQAEYFALLLGLIALEPLIGARDELFIFSDSQLLIKQLKGEYRVMQPTLRLLYAWARSLVHTKKYTLVHIIREDNYIADKLANQGIDQGTPLPSEFMALCAQHGIL
jgi:ribonuclease HI